MGNISYLYIILAIFTVDVTQGRSPQAELLASPLHQQKVAWEFKISNPNLK